MQLVMFGDLPEQVYLYGSIENFIIITSVFLIGSTCTVFIMENKSLRLKLKSEMARILLTVKTLP